MHGVQRRRLLRALVLPGSSGSGLLQVRASDEAAREGVRRTLFEVTTLSGCSESVLSLGRVRGMASA